MAEDSLPLVVDDHGEGALVSAVQSIGALNGALKEEMDHMHPRPDPDAQATVTDFLDFTEYLPSDMVRSLTLLQKLDQTYSEAAATLQKATKRYAELPNDETLEQSDPLEIRAHISETISEAFQARASSYVETRRMAESVEHHYNRAQNILAKLQAMAETYPPSRQPTPELQEDTPAARAQKALPADGVRPSRPKIHKRRQPRIIVPGEVLAPYELNYESYGSETEWDSEDNITISRNLTPAVSITSKPGRIKLKIPKVPKDKAPKPPRTPRPPGVMGTNVHSSVAGISTSNALAKLKPPPENPVLGSEDAPWLALTQWELAKLRKLMKKNAVWTPSDTMIARELKKCGRGIEAYRAAQQAIKDAGGDPAAQLDPAAASGSAPKVLAEGEIAFDALGKDDIQLMNRGMKLNEAKKLKRENQAKEAARVAAEEAEESARKLEQAAKNIKGLFSMPSSTSKPAEQAPASKTPSKTPKKRKREATVEAEVEKPAVEPPKPVANPPKKSKIETPVPAPTSSASSTSTTAPAPAAGNASGSKDVSPAPTPAPTLGQRKASTTPILPPVKDLKKPIKKEVLATNPAPNTRARNSVAPTPAPEVILTQRRPSSRGKATSLEPPTIGRDRPRRASTVHSTPAPEPIPVRTTGRRKRPPPGPVTKELEGSTAVSVGKRAAAPRKKAGPKKQKEEDDKTVVEEYEEVDDKGKPIDPDEPRYCLCNRVSFGLMIACEAAEVSI
jgi:hypothetical protein